MPKNTPVKKGADDKAADVSPANDQPNNAQPHNEQERQTQFYVDYLTKNAGDSPFSGLDMGGGGEENPMSASSLEPPANPMTMDKAGSDLTSASSANNQEHTGSQPDIAEVVELAEKIGPMLAV
jgi:hypothetical protein